MLEKSNNNKIISNNITRSDTYGIVLGACYYNLIYHNNFVGSNGATLIYDQNHAQAYDSNNQNFWNTSTEGNYWSDWTAPDNDSNGIVDMPYILYGGNAMDFYPLVNPVSDAGAKIPEPSPLPIIISSVLLLTAIVVRLRKN